MNKYTTNSKKADIDQQNAIFPFYLSRKQMHENFHETKTIQIGTIKISKQSKSGLFVRMYACFMIERGYLLTQLRWLDTVFQGQYLPSLSINYVAINKVLKKLPPQLF